MFFWYRNSFLASLVSIFGCAMVMVAIAALIQGEMPVYGAIPLAAAGGVVAYLGRKISENKAFKKWKKQLEAQGIDQRVRGSLQDAVTVYNANPGKKTLSYIQTLNPVAADQIRQMVAANQQK